MTDLFQNKYKIQSARLQSWNYANEGMYFVTICCANRECYFGRIVDGIMQFSEIGKIAETEWKKTIELRPDMNLELGEFVVMPNHFHGILIIGENKFNTERGMGRGMDGRYAMHRVSTNATNQPPNAPLNKFAPQSKNLASIMRGYKSAVTTYARKNNIQFGWQSRFHDHIIRSNDEYNRISHYILNNPTKWQTDKFHK